MDDTLILVDENDAPLGYEEKERCHRLPTRLHRAFSVFLFNRQGEMLIHRRSLLKKTWPGFWTNACCSHPRKGESLETATARRLKEELGIEAAPALTHLFAFSYNAVYDEEYGEEEVDHVFFGSYDGPVNPDTEEIAEWRYVGTEELEAEVRAEGGRFTPWFKTALPRVLAAVRGAT